MGEVHLGAHEGEWFDAEGVLLVDRGQQFAALAFENMPEKAALCALVGKAEHVAHTGGGYLAFGVEIGVGNGLVEDRETIANRPFGGVGHDVQSLRIGFDAFLGADVGEVAFEQFDRNAAQVETLGPAEHRDRQLFHLGRGEEELHMCRRFLKCLQQRIESIAGQHVNFVDDVDLVARRNRGVAHRFDDFAHVIDAGMAGGVHFDDVDVAAFGDGAAGLAYAAGADRGTAVSIGPDTVQSLGDEARGGGLPHPANAGHQEGVSQPIAGDGVGQRTHHRFLTDEFGEGLRTVFTGQNAVGLSRLPNSGGMWIIRMIGRRRRLFGAEHGFLSGFLEFGSARRVGSVRFALPRKAIWIVR